MRFAIDPDAGTPIYLQLIDQIRYAIAVGELRPGDALPSIRALEAELGLNRNTVRRAYLELREEGLLAMRRGAEARVADAPSGGAGALPAGAAGLARRLVQEVEAKGLDSVAFAARFLRAAAEHDASYPKCIFVECSKEQADDLAAATELAWRRRVIGVDIGALRARADGLPPSARYLITTHWHAAELRRLAGRRHPLVRTVRLRPAAAFIDGIRRLAGLKVGLILRDAASIAGYRALVRKHVRLKGLLPATLIGSPGTAEDLMRAVQGIVYTAPCRQFVLSRAPRHLVVQELLLEPAPEDLARIEKELFQEAP